MKKKIAIIGGGVVGATAAFYLSKQPRADVTLFDEPTGQGTSASAGIISPWLSKRRNKEWYHMVKTGAAFYPKFLTDALAKKDIPKAVYQQVGTLLFTKKDKNLEELLEIGLKRREEAPEIGELKILEPEEIRARIPIYDKEKRALFASGGARVDGERLVELLTKIAVRNGARFIQEWATLNAGRENTWLVKSPSFNETFDAVILANAAWLPETLAPFGYTVDVRPQKGQLAELQTDWETDNWPVIMPIGATHEDDVGFDLTLEKETLGEMVENAQSQFSNALSQEDIVSGRVGTRAYTSDFAPFFGEVPGMESVYAASGLGSTGLTAGPIVGKTLSDLVLGNEPVFNPENYPIQQYIVKGEN